MNQSKILPEFDCTRLCNSRQHGSILTSAVTKRAVSDAALASFFRCSCYNFLHIIDYEGRSLLHMVASRGRRLLLEWLIRRYTQSPSGLSIIDSKDTESGYTPFHRSIFYGQIQAAVSLMKAGANVSILDNEDMTAIDMALIDRHPQFELSKRMPCEVYTWGANSNYTLGTSSQHHRNFPELLSIFAKQGVHIKQVCLSKFHSAFISTAGCVWTCGHGEGGRLGVATGDTHVLPSSISLPEACTQAAVGRDHTILLLQSGIILSCGLNDHHQLGQVPPPRSSLSPRPVKLRMSGVRGVYAARYHSVAFNAHVLYTWGLHGGQLGHSKDKEKTILVPKKVTGIGSGQDDCTIECVAVSDGATVATTSKGDIYLLHQYQCKKIALRQHNIKSIKVIGGEVVGGDQLTEQQKQIMVLMLNSVGNVYLWQDTTNQFTRCIFNTNRPIYVMEVALTRETVMFTTKPGEAFHGNIMPKKITFSKTRTSNDDMISPKDKSKHDGNKSSFNQFINRDECVMIKLKRLANIHRAVDICCDIKGNNFAVLQVAPNSSLLDLPQVTSSQMVEDMEALLDEASEFDLLHDVIFKVKNNLYPAHRYVICYASEYFTKLCNDSQDLDDSAKLTIEIENIHPLIFKQILLFMYTGTCNLMSVGPCCLRIEINIEDNQIQIYEENTTDLDDLSAFEVYNKKEKTQKSNDKKNKEKSNKIKDKDKDLINDPVRLLQSAAKKLQINSLYKMLDKYGWQNGRVILRNENYKTNDFKCKFERSKLMDMWDANIKCSDGVVIKAHKCILAARLEYFNGMFAHAWAESSSESTITLPIRHKMLTPIINYLYSDECPELQECEDFEFIGNMLVICDQFFIVRMREMCEVALSNLITLKNVTEIIQIADTYNCPQLKRCCMEYISLNLSNLLETKSLETVTGTLLEELSEYYINFNPVMSKRIITPYSESVSDEVVASITESFPTNIEEDCDEDELDEMQKCTLINSGKKKSRIRKTSHSDDKIRKRNESLSSINSFDLSSERNEDVQLCLTEISNTVNESTGNGWTKVVSTHQKQQKIIQARLKAITSAKEDISLLESHRESFTKLGKKDSFTNDGISYSPIQSPTQKTYMTSSPILNSDDVSFESLSRSPQTTLNITVVNTKLSQKQRKKLALEYKDNSMLAEQLDKLNGKKSRTNTNVDPEPLPTQSQKNPWQKVQTTRTEPFNKTKATFSDILEDQRKQKENLSRMMTKSLALTQLEDKAIEELTRYYLSSNGDEERISVKRVPCHQIAPPQWIHKSFVTSPTRI